MEKPALVLAKELVDGDRLKLEAASNVTPSGGGARDFRFPKKHLPALERIFSREGERGGRALRLADLHYQKRNGQPAVQSDVELWEPTDSRPNEYRIAKIHKLEVFADPPPAEQNRVFAVFTQYTDGVVRFGYVTERQLRHEDSDRKIADALDAAVSLTPEGQAIIFSTEV